jgi:aryl-alcohol dehydrogenase-like predicted oxidoreductase
METTILGRTGLEVSVAGLGCGGHSRLGMTSGHDESHAVSIVEYAMDQGINFIDTARAYRTEAAVGKAIKGKRDQVVISTKSLVARGDELLSGQEVLISLEKSLVNLQTDYVDVYNLHGVTVEQYPHCVSEILPALLKQQEAGRIRYLGITETFAVDPSHEMLQLALGDDYFDVVMVGFNLLNPSARQSVFPLTIKNNVATQIMFAVRRALSQPDVLQEVIENLIDSGELEESLVDRSSPLGFIEKNVQVKSIVEAAYRFCRFEPGATVVLTGTGSKDHLKDNIESILAQPLPSELTETLSNLFGKIDSVSGN